MATIALGDGVVGVRKILEALIEAGFDGETTLEIAGVENVRRSVERLRACETARREQAQSAAADA